MRISASKSVNISVSFTEEEAEWLMGFIQNHPEAVSENSVEGALRKQLFEGLKVALYPDKVAYISK